MKPTKAPSAPQPQALELEHLRLLAKSDLVNRAEVTPEQAAVNLASGRGPTKPCPRTVGLLNVSDAAFDRLRAEGKFPPPLKIGRRMVRWRAECVRDWLEALPHSDIVA